ncbi:hypothetical protein [Mycoplasma todarodis]|uniref:Uncharacterized protein n=1 Tax=Mycoplasma todarodis TaxID=1937191 RepID=A0A4R0XRS3_9MOLU|nr:hypothetical protein [Mycoplasma todarodis]TCG10367.1 hypothetical protein C4B25_04510 [Mycoplasma todarodis]
MSDTKTIKKPVARVNFTVSKKGPKEWTVKKDGVDRYYHHTSKGEAFADAESKIKAVEGRSGRIKIHEDGKYTSNWFVEANKVTKLASGNQDVEILTLIKEQKAKIDALQQQKASKPAKNDGDALKIAKEAKAKALETEEENKKLKEENVVLTKEVETLKTQVVKISKNSPKSKGRSTFESVLLGFILLLTITIFVFLMLALFGQVDLGKH